jgi:hypothetical protein
MLRFSVRSQDRALARSDPLGNPLPGSARTDFRWNFEVWRRFPKVAGFFSKSLDFYVPRTTLKALWNGDETQTSILFIYVPESGAGWVLGRAQPTNLGVIFKTRVSKALPPACTAYV